MPMQLLILVVLVVLAGVLPLELRVSFVFSLLRGFIILIEITSLTISISFQF